MEPPASPVSDQRRPAASAEKLLPHVTIPTWRSSSDGVSTSTRTERRTQRCSGAPHPVSWTSSIAASCRYRAIASSRSRPVASVSERRTVYATRNVRPVSGMGTRASTRGTLFQPEDHPPVLVVRREVDVAKPEVEPLRRVVRVHAQRDARDALFPRALVDRGHERTADASTTLTVQHRDGDLGRLVVDVSLAVVVLREE